MTAVDEDRVFFTVVIPTFGSRPTVATAIQSVLDQTFDDYEVIVVDDASDPPAVLPIESPRVRMFRRQENGGVSAARNTGVQMAEGEWVTFLDDDDRFYPRRLEAMRAAIRAHPEWSLVTTDLDIYESGSLVGRFGEQQPFSYTRQLDAMLDASFMSAMTAVRRSDLVQIGGFDESLLNLEDWDCWLRMLHAGHKAGYVAEPLAAYNRGGGKSSNAYRFRKMRQQILDQIETWELTSPQREIVSRRSRHNRDRMLLLRSREALTTGGADRPNPLELLRAGTLPWRQRVGFAAALTWPSQGRRLIRSSRPPRTQTR